MKTICVCWFALLFTAVLGGIAEAAENPPAKDRAYLYQRETREVLIRRGWHISRDESGKIVADHPLLPMGAPASGSMSLGLTGNPSRYFAFDMFGWLTLTFRPDSTSHTHCTANIVAYHVERAGADGKKKASEPTPYDNPDSKKELQDIMIHAEKQMVAKHPEYAAH